MCVCCQQHVHAFHPCCNFNHLNTAVLHFTCSNFSNMMLLLLWKYSQSYWHGRCSTMTQQRGGIGLGIGIVLVDQKSEHGVRSIFRFEVKP